jgi:transcriptional regulator with XRE-family HTH domain
MSTTLREKLGRAVRRLRTQAGFSQESFADACHLHRTYIGSVERGEINISLDSLERIARTLKIPLSGLLLEAEQGR